MDSQIHQVTIAHVGTGTARIAGHSLGAGMEQLSLADGCCMAAGAENIHLSEQSSILNNWSTNIVYVVKPKLELTLMAALKMTLKSIFILLVPISLWLAG